MRIIDYIKAHIFGYGRILTLGTAGTYSTAGAWEVCRYRFSRLVWYNVCDLLIDLLEDVKLYDTRGTKPFTPEGDRFRAFRSFVYSFGRVVLQRLYDEGFIVAAYDPVGKAFCLLDRRDYTTTNEDGVTVVSARDGSLLTYVMKSSSWLTCGRSDLALCRAFLDYLDDILNGSATISKRLGAVVVASPKNVSNAPTAVVLRDEDKKELEAQMRKEYGALSSQSNIMLLPREMNLQTINLAGLDLRLTEKVRTAILAVADRIKVPASQVSIIDAQTSKALANGGEIREGDKLKYKTFRRLFERTFADMARFYGIAIDYAIDGEPIGESSEVTV